jgi:acyl carrier protein
MYDQLIEVFAEGLKMAPSELNEQTCPENTPEWDSLAAMTLVMLLEDSFEVRLSTREIMKMNSVASARSVLQAKGVVGI